MPHYKPLERNGLLLPVILAEQIQPGSFEFALDHLVDHELDLGDLDARFNNDETGAPAYDPRAMLKIVLLGYSRGLISSRRIAHACEHNIQFIALSGDTRPSYTHIAKFVRELGPQIRQLFAQVLITCDRMQLIGRQMFAIDGVKLPANASKERSGTHEELRHRARRLDKAAARIIHLHQSQDTTGGEGSLHEQRQARVDALRREAQRTREFVATSPQRANRKGQELKPYATAETVFTADAGYHSEDNTAALKAKGIAAMVADNQMRQRDERFESQAKHKAKEDPLYDKQPTGQNKPGKLFKPVDFKFIDRHTAICPAGKMLASKGGIYTVGRGYKMQQYHAQEGDCKACKLRQQCIKTAEQAAARKVSRFHPTVKPKDDPAELMRRAIDSPKGRQMYSQRIATVEPVFGNIRHNKRMTRFTLRGRAKMGTQWSLYCLVHNIEKLAGAGYGK